MVKRSSPSPVRSTLVTADLHLSDNHRDGYRHAFLRYLPDLVEKHNARRLLILGDLTEEKDRHGAWLVNEIVEHISALAELCPVYIIRGNHDYITAEHPFYTFVCKIKNVYWYNEPHTKSMRGLGNCLFLPHTTNYEQDWDEINYKEYDWIFAHQTFTGAVGENGQTLDGIPRHIFPRDAKVISGDVHVPQAIRPVTYVGAPYLIDFGDDYEPRMLLLDGSKIKSIPCKGAQKRLVDIISLTDLKKAEKNLQPGDVLKVRVTLDPSQTGEWAITQAAVRDWGAERGFLVHAVPVVSGGSPAAPKRSKTSPRNDKQLIEAYVKRRKASKAVLETGLRLLEEG